MPQFGRGVVYATCSASVGSEAFRVRLHAAAEGVSVWGDHFSQIAAQGQLHSIAASEIGDDDALVNDVSQKELISLYSNQLVPKDKPARIIYDTLRASAPNGRCPTCGFGQVNTLDHFLPKASYPWFSVLPENLVPACRDCNTEKLASSSELVQSFHPYFDGNFLMVDQWVYAAVVETEPPSIAYFVQAPLHWRDQDLARAENHFAEYELASRFAIEASVELANLRTSLSLPDFPKMNLAELKEHLRRILVSERRHQTNSWKIAMYEALVASDWFCEMACE